MIVSVLQQVLSTQRANFRRQGATPAIHQSPAKGAQEPFVVSLSRGGFAVSPLRDEQVWSGFQTCPLENEAGLIVDIYLTLTLLAKERQWHNQCSSLVEAQAKLGSIGLRPASVLMSWDQITALCEKPLTFDEMQRLMALQGCVAEVAGLKAFACEALPSGTALMTVEPEQAGLYYRVGNSVSLSIFGADRLWVLIDGMA